MHLAAVLLSAAVDRAADGYRRDLPERVDPSGGESRATPDAARDGHCAHVPLAKNSAARVAVSQQRAADGHACQFPQCIDHARGEAQSTLHVMADSYCSHVADGDYLAAVFGRSANERTVNSHSTNLAIGTEIVADPGTHNVSSNHDRADGAANFAQNITTGGLRVGTEPTHRAHGERLQSR